MIAALVLARTESSISPASRSASSTLSRSRFVSFICRFVYLAQPLAASASRTVIGRCKW